MKSSFSWSLSKRAIETAAGAGQAIGIAMKHFKSLNANVNDVTVAVGRMRESKRLRLS